MGETLSDLKVEIVNFSTNSFQSPEYQLESEQLGMFEEEIFSCAFNYEGNTLITASKDNTCRIWKDVDIV